MKTSKSLVALAIASLIPMGAALAGDGSKDKHGSMGPSFDTLDTNRDGRISQTEASADASLVFSSADQNGDGYLDKSEFKSRDKAPRSSPQSMPETSSPDASVPSPTPDSTAVPADDPSASAPQPDTETPRQ